MTPEIPYDVVTRNAVRDVQTLMRLFPDVIGWEPVEGDLWRGLDAHPPDCWRYVLLAGDRYASVQATFEFVRDGIGATEFIVSELGTEIRRLSAGDEQ